MLDMKILNEKIKVLEAQPPEVVYRDKKVTEFKQLPAPDISDNLGAVFDRYKSHADKKTKTACFNMLVYFKEWSKLRKQILRRREKVMINQKLEVIDGTFSIWEFVRKSLVNWLADEFSFSSNKAYDKKM